jgi:hypothetical protein
VLGQATGNLDSQDSPRPRLGGSHHLPPYSILCASPQGPHPNGFLSQYSQVGILKFPNLGLPQLWGPITFSVDLGLRGGLKQSFSPLSKAFQRCVAHHLHTMKSGRFLTFNAQESNCQFDHNLCFKCPNGSYKPISYI